MEEDPLKNFTEKCNVVQIVKLLNVLYTPTDGVVLTADIPVKLWKVLTTYLNDNLVH